MGQNYCQPECYDCCLKDHNAMLLQLEHLIAQSHSNRQPFMAYLLGMASCELRSIIDRTLQEALLQPKQYGKHPLCKNKNMPERGAIVKSGMFGPMSASSARVV